MSLRPISMAALAFDGLRRKIGRNLLTMSGVFIGVMALTMIVSLGEGLNQLILDTVQNEGNLRQIGLSPGFGFKLSEDRDVELEGVNDPRRRERLRRAALARRRAGTFVGRRAQTLDDALLERIATYDHVSSVTPIVLERYKVAVGEHETEATATLGISVTRRRYADRLIAGSYLSGESAREVLIHEYLAYQWGYRSSASLEQLVGRDILLTPLGTQRPAGLPAGIGPQQIAMLMQRFDLSFLDEADQAAAERIARKVADHFSGAGPADPAAAPAEPVRMKIVGVLREMETQDSFNVIEDGNAFQVDVFLPQATAVGLFLGTRVNQELGYSRALVLVDEASNASKVETQLREEGYTAFSVGSVVERVEGTLAAITVVVAFLTGIALIVAALGIVNTMVTSVLERTREIGLWKAVGATHGQVRLVFLLEGALIGLIGGLLGLGAALLLMIPGEAIAADVIAERALFPLRTGVFQVPSWLPVLGPALATVVAMLAALYPAFRASAIDPVRALRHD